MNEEIDRIRAMYDSTVQKEADCYERANAAHREVEASFNKDLGSVLNDRYSIALRLAFEYGRACESKEISEAEATERLTELANT